MKKHNTGLRVGAVALGAVILVGVTGVGIASAADEGDVDVSVDIAEIQEPGVLALTVADDEVALAEQGAPTTERTFTGDLPVVTVTDTRSPSEIPDGAFWAVLGSITDFVGSAGQPAIVSADSFGWTPRLAVGVDPGSVSEGSPVEPGEGFVDEEFLAVASDSEDIASEGSWQASAVLRLITPVNVAPGSYSATLTLSLFE